MAAAAMGPEGLGLLANVDRSAGGGQEPPLLTSPTSALALDGTAAGASSGCSYRRLAVGLAFLLGAALATSAALLAGRPALQALAPEAALGAFGLPAVVCRLPALQRSRLCPQASVAPAPYGVPPPAPYTGAQYPAAPSGATQYPAVAQPAVAGTVPGAAAATGGTAMAADAGMAAAGSAAAPGATEAPAAPAPAAPAPAAAGAGAPASEGCFEHSGRPYTLNWKAEGATFFDEWTFLTNDPNAGGAKYTTREQAFQQKVVEAQPGSAILRAGSRVPGELKRYSAKVLTNRKWTYFLAAMKFSHVPWGCGVWPAFWTKSPDIGWPNGGELDLLEYCNEIGSRSSFHVGTLNRCQLDANLLHKPGCPTFLDAEYQWTGHYDCVTNYPDQIGCAPNVKPILSGEEMASQPGVVAVEWTADYLKVFRIPEASVPQTGLDGDQPRPDSWDQWIVAYYPFAASERNKPGSCPNPARVMAAQQLVINLGFCGDWSAKVWINSTGMCANKPGATPTVSSPQIPSECVAVDPHDPKGEVPAGPRDCCTQYIVDAEGRFGTDAAFQQQAYFQMSWVKVFQQSGRRLAAGDGIVV